MCSIPWTGRSPGERRILQDSCLGNPRDRGACPLVGYSLWDLKRVGRDLATKTATIPHYHDYCSFILSL